MERSTRSVSIPSNKRNINRSLSKESEGSNIIESGEKISKSNSISIRTNSDSLLDRFIFKEQFKGWILILFRFMFYWMMAIDSWLEIPRSSNYTMKFNVNHFSLSSLPSITETHFTVMCIIISVLSIRCALGVNFKPLRSLYFIEPLFIAVFKGIMVLSSQSDNYQHHYLIVIILFTLSLVDIWYSPGPLKLDISYSCWPLKLLLLEVSVLYFWTSIAKIHPSWLNGSVLPRMIGPEFQELAKGLIHNLIPNLSIQSFFSLLSISTIFTEIFLVFSLHIDRIKPIVCLVGISMHWVMGISGLRIGTFSYFMVILYILRLPDQFSILFKPAYRITYKLVNEIINLTQILNQSLILFMIVDIFCFYFLYVIYSSFEPLPLKIVKFSFIIISIVILIRMKSETKPIKHTILLISTVSILIFFMIAPKSTILRDLYTEKATMAIGLADYDSAILNYQIAERYSREEWNIFRFIPNGANHIDDGFEFIGDLGLFLESKKQFQEALDLYQYYSPKYPRQLKIQIGLIRTLQELKYNSSVICPLIPDIQKLATTLSTQNCHSVACERISKHANYSLQVSNQIFKLNKCK